MTGYSSPGSQISSSRLAIPARAMSVIPSSSKARCAAATWGGPPSTRISEGGYAKRLKRPVSSSSVGSGGSRWCFSRRVITSCMEAVSSRAAAPETE